MKEAKKAAFNLEFFKITKFSLSEPTVVKDGLSIKFDPSGEYDSKTGIYKLTLGYTAFQEVTKRKKDTFIECTLIAQFKIDTSDNNIPDYFYRNSIAIIYPYLRSFITTLTIQANLKPLIMPLLNLSDLEKPLRDNTVIK